jgi:hypothetical protein
MSALPAKSLNKLLKLQFYIPLNLMPRLQEGFSKIQEILSYQVVLHANYLHRMNHHPHRHLPLLHYYLTYFELNFTYFCCFRLDFIQFIVAVEAILQALAIYPH